MRYHKIFLLFVLALWCFATACSGDYKAQLDPKNPVNITVWHYYNGTQKNVFDELVQTFNDTMGREQGIVVAAVSYGSVDHLSESVLSAARGELDAGEMPNIFGSYGDTALEIVNLGKAAEIDAYLTKQELAKYEESFLQEGRLGKEHLYVFPVAKSTELLMLNQTDFDAFLSGLDSEETIGYDDLATWEGVLRVAEVYHRHTGKAFMGIDVPANYLLIGSKQLGRDLVRVENGEAVFDLDESTMHKLWYSYYKPMVTGRFTKLGKFCSDDIKTGDSLCFLGSMSSAGYFPTALATAEDELRPVSLRVLPMPVFEGGESVAVSQGAGMVIAKSNQVKEYAAAVFLKWFTAPEQNVSFSLNAGYLPVMREALNEEFLAPVLAVIDVSDAAAQNAANALKVGIEQLRNYQLHAGAVFDGSVAFRNKLPNALTSAVYADREIYLTLLDNGYTHEQAYEELHAGSAGKFSEWLEALSEVG